MRSSSPSNSHCTQVPIKTQHRAAKQRLHRRKRIDLNCGCSYYLSLNCRNHGFTHRGTHHCASGTEWRLYLGNRQSPIFQHHGTLEETVQLQPRHHHSTTPIQPQPKEGTGDSQVFHDLQDLDNLTASDWSFLKSL
uniref:Transcriptional activator protein n=1 Tax=Tomato leaf curl virus TaxID=28350 RepID=A0A6G9IYD7_9GEMI|nr:transcription activator protein [Tomato leaf curl virus]QIQ31356.1 transcription activator protein [Tomato leaf curl virus]